MRLGAVCIHDLRYYACVTSFFASGAGFETGCAHMPERPLLCIGFVVFCPVTRVTVYSYCELPLWYFTRVFAADERTYIAQGEAVGALAPLLSVPALLRGRPAIQFQDNTGGRSRLSCTATHRGPTWAAW